MIVQYRFRLFVVLLSVALCAATAGAVTLESLLEAMPPDTAEAADALFDAALEADDTLLVALCDRMVSSESPRDAAAEFALYGLAKHVVPPGRESQRARVSRIFEATLDRAASVEERRFFISLLVLCGDDATVTALEPYVCDAALGDDAVRAIASIGGFEAVMPLYMKSCPDAPGKDASIQNALTNLSSQAHYTPQETGLSAELLAAIAAPETVDDPSRIRALSREALREESIEPHHQTMVLQLLAMTAGQEALPDLLNAMKSPHRPLWGMALLLAAGLEGDYVSQAVIAALPELEEAARTSALAMLGGRPDAVAQRAVREALTDPLLETRLAAYDAVSPASDDAFLPLLMDAMEHADSEREVQAVKNALLRLPDLETKLTEALPSRKTDLAALPPAQKVAYLEIIAERQAERISFSMLRLFEDDDARVRRTAYTTVGALIGVHFIEALYERLLAEERDAEADAARNAIVASVRREEKETAAALQRKKDLEAQGHPMPTAPQRRPRSSEEKDAVGQAEALLVEADAKGAARLIKTLGALGTEAALNVVRQTAEQRLFVAPDEAVGTTLLETLGLWQAPEAGVILVTLWQRLDEESLRLAALRNYIISVQRNYGEPAKQGELLSVILEQCRTEAERGALEEAIAKTLPEEEKP